MLSGLQNVGQSMFDSRDPGKSMFSLLTPENQPSPEDMEAAKEEALYSKSVTLKKIGVKTFDLSVAKDVIAYKKLMLNVYHGHALQTHIITCHDRQFVTTKEKPRWIAHVEWAEFDFKKEANPVVGQGAEEDEEDSD